MRAPAPIAMKICSARASVWKPRSTTASSPAIGVATSSAPGNPRGANTQLDGEFSRKSLYLDLAYFDWTFADNAHFIAGKMKMPFVRPGQSLFWDNDINPEGIALTYSRRLAVRLGVGLLDRRERAGHHHGGDHHRHQDVWCAAGQSFRSRQQHSGGRGFVLRSCRRQGPSSVLQRFPERQLARLPPAASLMTSRS